MSRPPSFWGMSLEWESSDKFQSLTPLVEIQPSAGGRKLLSASSAAVASELVTQSGSWSTERPNFENLLCFW